MYRQQNIYYSWSAFLACSLSSSRYTILIPIGLSPASRNNFHIAPRLRNEMNTRFTQSILANTLGIARKLRFPHYKSTTIFAFIIVIFIIIIIVVFVVVVVASRNESNHSCLCDIHIYYCFACKWRGIASHRKRALAMMMRVGISKHRYPHKSRRSIQT